MRIHRGGACVVPGMRALSLVSACVLASAVQATDGTFTGYARSLTDGKLLYVESHAVQGAGTPDEKRIVLYQCAGDAAPFARKELVYSSRTAPAFRFEDARSGYAEGLSRDARGLTVSERAGHDARPRSEILEVDGTIVADAGFDEFVRARWDKLERGVPSNVPFLVPTRLDSVPFRVRKIGEAEIDGATVSVIRLSLAGPLGWFVPDIEVSYRKSDRRLLRYRGLTNIRDADGRLIEAQIDFPDTARSVGPVDLTRLSSLALVDHCR